MNTNMTRSELMDQFYELGLKHGARRGAIMAILRIKDTLDPSVSDINEISIGISNDVLLENRKMVKRINERHD